ncbi:MAG: D-TA family PLP-dependent enzyme, partial [Planctomycetia bacterium]|nr:D-TA family PLP-dependent enzyme [Planctomycetia bacterium]
MPSWFQVKNTDEFLSPSLIIDRGLLTANLRKMIEVARGADRLRPHVKTHKMPAVVRLAESLGIRKHKCATIAEAEMVAEAGGTDVLIAYPIVGPNVARLAKLIRHYPATVFRTIVDDPDACRSLSEGMSGLGRPLPVLIDLEVGMGRTGIAPGEKAEALHAVIDRLPNLVFDGLSAYDGHIHDFDPKERSARARPGIEQTLSLRDRLGKGSSVPRLVLGGTPTFPIHAALDEPGVECSPGTCTLHDVSYATKYPDLPFTPAAALLTRVISRPRPGRICLDLGHKAVAADPAGPRVALPDIPDAVIGGQSEEHLVV